jgi:hypothetical protein
MDRGWLLLSEAQLVSGALFNGLFLATVQNNRPKVQLK